MCSLSKSLICNITGKYTTWWQAVQMLFYLKPLTWLDCICVHILVQSCTHVMSVLNTYLARVYVRIWTGVSRLTIKIVGILKTVWKWSLSGITYLTRLRVCMYINWRKAVQMWSLSEINYSTWLLVRRQIGEKLYKWEVCRKSSS